MGFSRPVGRAAGGGALPELDHARNRPREQATGVGKLHVHASRSRFLDTWRLPGVTPGNQPGGLDGLRHRTRHQLVGLRPLLPARRGVQPARPVPSRDAGVPGRRSRLESCPRGDADLSSLALSGWQADLGSLETGSLAERIRHRARRSRELAVRPGAGIEDRWRRAAECLRPGSAAGGDCGPCLASCAIPKIRFPAAAAVEMVHCRDHPRRPARGSAERHGGPRDPASAQRPDRLPRAAGHPSFDRDRRLQVPAL